MRAAVLPVYLTLTVNAFIVLLILAQQSGTLSLGVILRKEFKICAPKIQRPNRKCPRREGVKVEKRGNFLLHWHQQLLHLWPDQEWSTPSQILSSLWTFIPATDIFLQTINLALASLLKHLNPSLKNGAISMLIYSNLRLN